MTARDLSTDTPSSPKTNRLNYLQASALLVADCMGVGVLALPQDVHVLGWGLGLGFLLLNLPINLHAGIVLADAALLVEEENGGDKPQESCDDALEMTSTRVSGGDPVHGTNDEEGEEDANGDSSGLGTNGVLRRKSKDGLFRAKKSQKYTSVPPTSQLEAVADESAGMEMVGTVLPQIDDDDDDDSHHHHHHNPERSEDQYDEDSYMTNDLVGITAVLFRQPLWTNLVLVIYMLNLSLVLGDYVLVMSHAVTAMVGEHAICLPTAGIFASILMFGLSQLNTMALLGREVSILSVLAAIIILVQCLIATHQPDATHKKASDTDEDGIFRKFSALYVVLETIACD